MVALTKRPRVYGLVIEVDGTQTVLEAPEKAEYVNEPGGLFWRVKHKGGIFQVQASRVYKYQTQTTQPGATTGAATMIRPGAY